MQFNFSYIKRNSFIHNLSGASKFICLLLVSFASMLTYDTRLLAFLSIFSILLFFVSNIKFREVSFLIVFTGAFVIFNNILIFLFSSKHGVSLYGTEHIILKGIWGYDVTLEQLFYHLNLILKYTSSIPIVVLFVSTTHPSEFASSLNKIGVNYKIAYSISLALRYIPDIQDNYYNISSSVQARGVELSKKASFLKRIKGVVNLLIPLILSSMQRIEIISDAMELRGFGKNKKRTWYQNKKFTKFDYLSIFVCSLFLIACIALNYKNGSRFWNPFI